MSKMCALCTNIEAQCVLEILFMWIAFTFSFLSFFQLRSSYVPNVPFTVVLKHLLLCL
jgi:hypothetical protein